MSSAYQLLLHMEPKIKMKLQLILQNEFPNPNNALAKAIDSFFIFLKLKILRSKITRQPISTMPMQKIKILKVKTYELFNQNNKSNNGARITIFFENIIKI